MSLRPQGKSALLPERLTSQRTAFSPALVRYANLAPQTVSAWSAASGTATITTGIAAPDSTADAATLSTVAPPENYRRIYNTERTLAIGDRVIAGVWVKAAALSQGASQADGTMDGFAAATLRIEDDTAGYAFDIDGLNYRELTTTSAADSRWEWVSTNIKIESAPSGNTANLILDLNCDSEHEVSFYAPILWHVPADELTEDDVDELMLGLFSVPDSTEPGRIATLRGQSFQSALIDTGGQKVNVKAYGAVGDGITSDELAVSFAAAKSVATGTPLYFPAGTYLGINLSLGDDVIIVGDGQLKTILKGTDGSAPVITTTGSRVRIRDLEIHGSGTGTTAEHGIYVTGITAGLEIRNVQIKNVGGCGIKATQWFSGVISDVDVDFAGLDGIDLNEAAAGPSVMLVNCYVHSIEPGFAAYRLRRGYFWLLNCNSLDGPLASGETTCVIVGQTTTGSLDATTSVAFAHFQNCNFESYRFRGTEFRGASAGSFDECVWAGNIAGALPIKFIDGGATRRGYLGATCQFGNSDDRATNYPNAREIECPGLPPLTIVGPVGSFGSFAGVTDYYDTTLSRVEYLLRTDGALSTITASGDYTAHVGTRLIDCQVSAPATITIPWAGEVQAGYVITVQDGSGNAATHNLTIAAAGGSAIDGAGSRTINVNRGALTFVSNGTNWTTISSAPVGVSQRVAVFTAERMIGSDADLTFDGFNLTSGRVYHSGGNAGAPGIAPSGDNTTGFFSVASGEYGFSSGGEKLRFQANGLFIREGNRITWDDSETRFDLYGSGSPEGVVAAGIGSTFRRSDGSTGTTFYVKESGTGNTGWVAYGAGSGSGDVVGPGSSTDNALARFDSTTGKLIQDSGVTLSDLATNTYTLAANPPTVAGTSTAGYHFISRASDAIAGNVTNGAAAGGDYYAIAGDAARLNTGDANGGNLYLTPGAKIGSGSDGQIIVGRNGTGAVPAITWAGALNSGISNFSSGIQFTYAGSNNAAITANGAKFSTNGRVAWSSDTTTFGTEDLSIWRHAANVARIGGDNTGAVAGKLFVSRSDKTHVGWFTVDGDTANTNAVADVGAIGLDSTGTAAAGLGAQLQFTLESTTTNQQQAAGMTWVWTTATHASRTADLFFSTVNSATVGESLRLVAGGAWRTPAIADPSAPTNGDTWRSSTRNAISTRVSGQTEDLSTTMWRSSAQSIFDTTSSATSVIADTGVGTKTVAADRLVAGTQIRITAGGLFGTKASSAGTLTMRVNNGGTTMVTAVFTLPDGLIDQAWSLEAVGALNATGGSGVIYWRLAWLMTDASGVVYMSNVVTNSTTINTTTSRVLDVTAQFSASDADNYFQTDNAMIEVLA